MSQSLDYVNASQLQHVKLDALSELKELLGDEKFKYLIDIYCENSQNYIGTLRDGVASEDFESLHITAHSMKGSSATMGALILADKCYVMEQQAEEKQAADLVAVLDDIAEEHQHVITALKNYL